MATPPIEVKTKRERQMSGVSADQTTSAAAGRAAAPHPPAAQANSKRAHKPPPLIAFGIIDGKVDESGKLTILEFGVGQTSVLMDAKGSLEKVRTFIKESTGLSCYTTQEIMSSESFTNSLQHTSSSTRFSDYACVHSVAYGDEFDSTLQNTRVLLQNNSPSWILASYVKSFMHAMFEQSKQLAHRPKCRSYSVVFTPSLPQNIERDFPNTNTFVLKTPFSTRGEGVFISPRQELKIVLPLLLASEHDIKQAIEQYKINASRIGKSSIEIKEDLDQVMSFRKTRMVFAEFLVEEYCTSKPVKINEKFYEATIRVEFLILIDEDTVHFHGINCYWDVVNDVGFHAANPQVQLAIFLELKPIMTAVFKHIHGLDVDNYFIELSKSCPFQLNGGNNNSFMLLVYYVNKLVDLGHYKHVIDLFENNRFNLNTITNLNPECEAALLSKIGMAYFFNAYCQDNQEETLAYLSQAWEHLKAAVSRFKLNEHSVKVVPELAEYLLKLSIIESRIEGLSKQAEKRREGAFKVEAQLGFKEGKLLKPFETKLNNTLSKIQLLYARRNFKAVTAAWVAAAAGASASAGAIITLATAPTSESHVDAKEFSDKTKDPNQKILLDKINTQLKLYQDYPVKYKGYLDAKKLNIFITLLASQNYQEQLAKALRTICAYGHLGAAFDLAKILLEHLEFLYRDKQDKIAELVNDAPAAKPGNADLPRTAIQHAKAKGNQALVELLQKAPFNAKLNPEVSGIGAAASACKSRW